MIGLLSALLLLAATATWLLTTEAGRDVVLERVEAILPGEIDLGSAEGVLAGPLILRNVRWQGEGLTLAIDRASFDWSPRALLAGRVHVSHVRATGIDVELAEAAATEQQAPIAAPALPDTLGLPVPVPVTLDELRIGPVRVRVGDRTTGPFELSLAATHAERAYRIRELALATPWGEASGDVELAAAAPFEIAAELEWRTRSIAPLAPAAGTLKLAGDLERLQVEFAALEPGRLTVSGSVQPLAASPAWDLVARTPGTSAADWIEDAPAWSLSGRIGVRGDAASTRLSGGLAMAGTPLAEIETEFALKVDAAGALVERLVVRPAENPGRIEAEGSIDWSGAEPRIAIDLGWRDLAWPFDDPQARSEGGALKVSGSPDDYGVTGRFDLAGLDYPAGDWRIDLAGDRNGLGRFALSGDWLDAAWTAGGTLAWGETLRGSIRLGGEGVDPARFDLPVSGDVGFDLAGDWALVDGEPQADIRVTRLEGDLAERALSASGGVAVAGDRVEVDALELRAGEAVARLDGRVRPDLDLTFDTSIDDLASLLPGAAGSLEASGRVRGELPRPALRVELAGRDLAWQDFAVGGTELAAEVPVAAGDSLRIAGHVAGLRVAGQAIDRVAIDVGGTLADHVARLQIARKQDRVGVELTGDLSDPAAGWQGVLRRLDIEPERFFAWQLAAPAELVLSAERVVLEMACLAPALVMGGQACAGGSWTMADGWQVDAHVDALEIGPLLSWFEPGLVGSGQLNLRASARGDGDGEPSGRLDVLVSPGYIEKIEGAGPDERFELLAWHTLRARAGLSAQGIDAELEVPLAPTGRIEAAMRLGPGGAARSLDGRLVVDSERIASVAEIAPDIGRVRGRAEVDLTFGGTLERPTVAGSAALHEGVVGLPRAGIELRNVAAEISGDEGDIRTTLAAESGPGRIEITAETRRGPEGWRAQGRAEGADFRALDTREARVEVSPAIDWAVDGDTVRVNGELVVPSARIAPRDLGAAVSPTQDLRIVGTQDGSDAVDSPGRLQVDADLSVQLGEDVRFEGFGLEGNLAGGLRVREQPGRVATANGEIRVEEGSYSAYRQTLEIERGRLIYDGGAVTDPGLDIRAVRRPRNVLVGVRVRGTMRDPQVELFSEPPMQESQILSYLVLGIPLGETGGEDRDALAGALAGAGGWLAGKVGGGIGVDDVEIERGDSQADTSLVLGTYLHPRLYVSYGVGLFERFSQIRIRYSMGSRWAIEGESGVHSGGDLIYSIER